jgi:1,2-diacylglycerol 3-alpha-glucosyltransferase
MRIALACTGLGRVRRGFESFTESLFQALRLRYPEVEVTLFQASGRREKGRVNVPNLHRADIPLRWLDELKALHWETRSFATALYPLLRLGHYDVVHYNELTMGSALFHLRRLFGGRFKLLYCNGAPSPPIHYYNRCDFAQLLTEPQYQEATAFGMHDDRLFQIPYGIDSTLFNPDRKSNRIALRKEIGVPDDVRLIVSVAAIKREHKRIDYLLTEASSLPDVWVVVAGQPTDDTPYLEQLAEKLMPGRWRFVSWPQERIADLYGAADVFALCSLTEAFGLVTIEAMLSEVPAIVHNGPVFGWLTEGTSARRIDMSVPGKLSSAIIEVLRNSGSPDQIDALRGSRQTVSRRFSWDSLAVKYLDMYSATIAPAGTIAGSSWTNRVQSSS